MEIVNIEQAVKFALEVKEKIDLPSNFVFTFTMKKLNREKLYKRLLDENIEHDFTKVFNDKSFYTFTILGLNFNVW